MMRTPALQQLYEENNRDSDVILNTFAKCGQTLLQFQLILLKRRGDLTDFPGLLTESPWLELILPSGETMEDVRRKSAQEMFREWQKLPDPRVFKAHLTWDEVCCRINLMC
jgi:hypothetical protein